MHLERYLYSDYSAIRMVRRDFASIAASLDMFSEVNSKMFRKLAELIRESFRALNGVWKDSDLKQVELDTD